MALFPIFTRNPKSQAGAKMPSAKLGCEQLPDRINPSTDITIGFELKVWYPNSYWSDTWQPGSFSFDLDQVTGSGSETVPMTGFSLLRLPYGDNWLNLNDLNSGEVFFVDGVLEKFEFTEDYYSSELEDYVPLLTVFDMECETYDVFCNGNAAANAAQGKVTTSLAVLDFTGTYGTLGGNQSDLRYTVTAKNANGDVATSQVIFAAGVDFTPTDIRDNIALAFGGGNVTATSQGTTRLALTTTGTNKFTSITIKLESKNAATGTWTTLSSRPVPTLVVSTPGVSLDRVTGN